MTPFSTPPQTTNPGGLAGQAAAAGQTAGTSSGTDVETIMSSGPQLISGMPQALQSLAIAAGLRKPGVIDFRHIVDVVLGYRC